MTSFSLMTSPCWYNNITLQSTHTYFCLHYFWYFYLPAFSVDYPTLLPQKYILLAHSITKSICFSAFLPHFQLGPELQSADRDPSGPGEQQEHAGAESEPQQHRFHPQPVVHQPDRPAVSGPERQQARQPATPDETPGAPADSHTEQ